MSDIHDPSFPQYTPAIHLVIPATHHVIPTKGDLCITERCGEMGRSSRLGALLPKDDTYVLLRHLPPCPRAEDRGACGDEQAAGKGEQEQQAA